MIYYCLPDVWEKLQKKAIFESADFLRNAFTKFYDREKSLRDYQPFICLIVPLFFSAIKSLRSHDNQLKLAHKETSYFSKSARRYSSYIVEDDLRFNLAKYYD